MWSFIPQREANHIKLWLKKVYQNYGLTQSSELELIFKTRLQQKMKSNGLQYNYMLCWDRSSKAWPMGQFQGGSKHSGSKRNILCQWVHVDFFWEVWHFYQKTKNKKTLRNMRCWKWCVSKMQLTPGKWKKTTKALFLGFREEVGKEGLAGSASRKTGAAFRLDSRVMMPTYRLLETAAQKL